MIYVVCQNNNTRIPVSQLQVQQRMRWCSEVISVSGAHPPLAPVFTVACFSNNRSSVVLQFQRPFIKFNKSFCSFSLRQRKLLAVQAQLPSSSRGDYFDFVVINFYHFVFIKDPRAEVVKQLRSCTWRFVSFSFSTFYFSYYWRLNNRNEGEWSTRLHTMIDMFSYDC